MKLAGETYLLIAVVAVSSLCAAGAEFPPECIKYEVHERARAVPSQVQVLMENCYATNSYIDSYSAAAFSRPGPVVLNVTFEVCSKRLHSTTRAFALTDLQTALTLDVKLAAYLIHANSSLHCLLLYFHTYLIPVCIHYSEPDVSQRPRLSF